MRSAIALIAVAMAVVASACENTEDMREVRDGQRELRAKLESLEKKIDAMAARPAAAQPAALNQPDPNKVYTLPIGDSPTRGAADGSVTLVEFADFQCPFCARNLPLINQILEAYPKDVKFVYKEFPLTSIHNNAMNASKAAVAAQKQGKYWEMHDKLFENYSALDYDNLKKYAGEVGLNVEQWEKDMKSPEVEKRVQDDIRVATQADVRGTPTLFIDGKRINNRQLEAIKATIDAALAAKKPGKAS